MVGLREGVVLGVGAVEEGLPLVGVAHEVLVNVLKAVELPRPVELAVDVGPLVVGDPGGGVLGDGDLTGGAREQVPPLLVADLVVALADLDGEDEGEEELVLFEEGPADVFVEGVGEVVVDVEEPLLEDVGGGAGLDAQHEQPHEPLQGVLVHRVDQRKVYYAEEQQGRPVGHRSVPLTGLVDLLLGELALLDPFVDFLTGLLGVGKFVDEGLVLEELVNVALGAGEGLEDGVLDLDEGLAVLSVLGDDLNLLLLHLRVLESHYLGQHLLLEPRGCDCEVDDGHLHEYLGRVVGVGQRCCHEKLKALAVVQGLLPDGDRVAGAGFDHFLEEDGLK